MFRKYNLDLSDSLFTELASSLQFESAGLGRIGALIVDSSDARVPLVRTTAIYHQPNQVFPACCYDLSTGHDFNNARVEIYDCRYRSMKFHSDMSLDLDPHSEIGTFSCYEDPRETQVRQLVIENKRTGEVSSISLDHNSLVLFSVETNAQYRHKIILPGKTQSSRWLGITFRRSRSYLRFEAGVPYLGSEVLHLASPEEHQELLRYKGQENREIGFQYPALSYTLSPGDLMPII